MDPMTKVIALAVALAACSLYTGDDAIAPDAAMDATSTACDRVSGSTCEAAYILAEHYCARGERCWPERTADTCIEDSVTQLCAGRDCAEPYNGEAVLAQCLAAFDAQQCVTLGPPLMCSL